MHNRIAAATSVLFNPFITPIAATLVIAENYAATTREMLMWMGIAFTFFTIADPFYLYPLPPREGE